MVVLLIVPIEEVATERFGVLDAAEALREPRLVFHCFGSSGNRVGDFGGS
jgi:hypothetical protein